MRKCLLFFLFTLSMSVYAQKDRPVVGVVLSGGGAKGFAHVGMLQILDSLGIPVDYVAGTSMGAVIGGMYAVGYTPDQIEKIVKEVDWVDIMSNAPERKYLTHLNKTKQSRYLFKANLQGFGIVAPSGYITGQKMLAKLNEVTQGYHGDINFLEDLPRKFLCVATDLRTGSENVYTSGSLPDLIRASVSIPSMFTPYRLDGELKVDGGMVNNFPSDHLKALGCDIIIGLSVESPAKDSLGVVSIVEVLETMGMFLDYKTNIERHELCDVVINPDMEGYTLTDFTYGKEIVDIGLRGARKHLDVLEEIARKTRSSLYEYPPAFKAIDSVYVGEVKVTGLQKRTVENIKVLFDVEPDDKLSIDDLEERINVLYGTDRFEQIQYKLSKGEGDKTNVNLEVIEKKTDTQFGVNLHYDSDFGAAVGLNITKYDALLSGAIFGIDFTLRESPRVKLFYDLDRGKYPGFHFEVEYYSARPNIYSDKQYTGELKFGDLSTYLGLQSSINRKYNLQLGIGLDYQHYNFEKIPGWVSDPINNADSSSLNSLHVNWVMAKLEMDNLDQRDFPTKGARVLLKGSVTQLLNESDAFFSFNPFVPLSFDYFHAVSPSRWLTIMPRARAGFTLMNESSYPYKMFTGSFGENNSKFSRGFPGYRFMEYSILEEGQYYYPQNINSLECFVRFKVGNFGYLTAMGGGGTGSHDIDNLYKQYFGGIGLGYSLGTLFGPIELIVHKSTDHANVYGYLRFGYWL